MSAYPPIDFNVPLDLDAIASNDPKVVADYFREFHNSLSDMQTKTSNAIYGVIENFQPSINNTAKSATIDDANYDSRTATYNRIGNLIWVTMSVHWSGADVTGTGELIIQGLPFASNKRSLFSVFDNDNASDKSGVCQIAAGDKDLTTFTVGSPASNMQVEDNHELIITGVYLAEA